MIVNVQLFECACDFAVDFASRRDAFGELGFFGGGKFDFNDFLNAVLSEDNGDADTEVFFAVFAVEVDATRDKLLGVEGNGLNQSRRRCARSIPGRRSEELRASRAAHFGSLNGFSYRLFAEELGNGNAAIRCEADERNHGFICVPADNHTVNIGRGGGVAGFLQSLCEVVAETTAVEHAALSDYAIARELRVLEREIS